ncbi:MAG TPA: DoxX family protein [Planctomycetota bacterium]|nr:DoxX family protein [Planctomycetota bacterium]
MGSGTLLKWFISTDASFGALATRLTLGICMLPHGVQKLQGFSGMMKMFSENMGIPAPLAFLVIMAESFGAAGLILGVLGRFCAFGIGLTMVGAIWLVHGPNGFMLMDPNSPGKVGYEYNLALLGLSVAVMLMGSGAFSFDRWLSKRMQASDAPAA